MADLDGPRPARRPTRELGALVVAGLLLASCTTHGAAAAVTGAGTPTAATLSSAPPVPAADLAAIDSALDAINATAGGTVAAQRTVLERLVVQSEAHAQRDCPTAHNTLRLQAVPDDLRRSPDDTTVPTGTVPTGTVPTGTVPTGTVPTGTVPTGATTRETDTTGAAGADTTDYLLPVLITIFTGDRITGTDLTTLRLFVTNGTARIGHLCVS